MLAVFGPRPFLALALALTVVVALPTRASAQQAVAGPTTVYVGDTIAYGFTPESSPYGLPQGTYCSSWAWSTPSSGGSGSSSSAGSITFAITPPPSDPCNLYSNPMTDSTHPGCFGVVTALATKIGTVTIQCSATPSSNGSCVSAPGIGGSPIIGTITVNILPRNRPPDKMPLGAKLRRVDVHGVPMPDPSPTGEGEKDRIPNMAYTDMYDLSPHYAVTDVSVSIEGGELALEFRRTMGIHSRNYNPDLTKLGITYPTEDFLGLGWDANLGARILLTTEKDSNGINYNVARVIDETGNSYTYQADPAFTTFIPDTTHSFNNESVKAHLVAQGGGLVLTRAHGTTLTFQYANTFYTPASVGQTCSPPTFVHSEAYYSLASVTDRNGNQLRYTYYPPNTSTTGPEIDQTNLVVHTIAFVDHGHPEDNARIITINASHHSEFDENAALGIPTGRDTGWRIDSVQDPLGRVTTYAYAAIPAGISIGGLPASTLPGLLQTVTRPAVENPANPAGALVSPQVSFTYFVQDLTDMVLDPTQPPPTPAGINRYVAPATITDARGNTTSMSYNWTWFPAGYYPALGSATWQARIYLTSMATIDGTATFALTQLPTFAYPTGSTTPSTLSVATSATDTRGVTTGYVFNSAITAVPNSIGAAIFVTDCERTTAGIGTTTFTWADPSGAPDPNNNLVQVTDLSGHAIQFAYTSGAAGDAYDQPLAAGSPLNSFANPNHYMAFNQPATRTVVALGLLTQYRYDTVFNKQIEEIDAEGVISTDTLDAFGNRTALNEALGTAVARTTLYGYGSYIQNRYSTYDFEFDCPINFIEPFSGGGPASSTGSPGAVGAMADALGAMADGGFGEQAAAMAGAAAKTAVIGAVTIAVADILVNCGEVVVNNCFEGTPCWFNSHVTPVPSAATVGFCTHKKIGCGCVCK